MNRSMNVAVVAVLSIVAWGCGQDPGGAGDGTTSSTQIVAPGEQCPNGGVMILTGIDVDGSGVLDSNEVMHVEYVCNTNDGGSPTEGACTTLAGSFHVGSLLDWEYLVTLGCTRITGTLSISPLGVGSLSPPSPLVEVGDLMVSGTELESLPFPALTTVDGVLLVGNSPALTSLELPSLAAAGSITIDYNAALANVSLPSLVTLDSRPEGQGVQVRRNGSLATVSLPALTSASLLMLDAPALTSLDLTSLATVTGPIEIVAPVLPALDLPALTAAEWLRISDQAWPVPFGGLTALQAPNLTRLSLPLFASADLVYVRLTGITSLELPALTYLPWLQIEQNDELTSVSLPSLVTLDNANGQGSVRWNGALASVSLPKLTSVDSLIIDGTPLVASVDLHSLTTASGSLAVSSNSLVELDLPLLTSAGELALGGSSLATLNLPDLATVHESLSLTTGPLTDLCLPELTQVSRDLLLQGEASALTGFSVPKLESVGGGLAIYDHSALADLYAPALARAGNLVIQGGQLAVLSLPSLALVAPDVPQAASVVGNLTLSVPGVSTVDLPSLATVNGTFDMANLPMLTSLNLPALATSNAIAIRNAPLLPSVALPSLTRSTLTLLDNPMLTSVQAPLATSGGIEVGRNAALTTLGFPLMADGGVSLKVYENPALTSLDLPALTSVVWTFAIHDNPLLPQCQALAILAQLTAPPLYTPYVLRNDTAATCP